MRDIIIETEALDKGKMKHKTHTQREHKQHPLSGEGGETGVRGGE